MKARFGFEKGVNRLLSQSPCSTCIFGCMYQGKHSNGRHPYRWKKGTEFTAKKKKINIYATTSFKPSVAKQAPCYSTVSVVSISGERCSYGSILARRRCAIPLLAELWVSI